MNTQNHIASPYRDLPLSMLQESPTNPRRRYDEPALQELATSIQAQGILAPLLVRQLESKHFEVIAGSRRFRAAKIAELSQVPVRVVEMTDAQVLEAQCVENLQREDVHPLEEGNAFAAMLKEHYDIATIAAKIGKPAAFVVNRIQLTQLIPPIAEAFLADKLTIGHATLIAKLPTAQQPEAFTASYRSVWMTEGQTQILVPVKELASWIESNILMELRTAPFDRKDATLLPEAGSCHDCLKRTGANALLFPEAKRESCLDRLCFQSKIDAHVAKTLAANPKLVQISNSWKASRSGDVLGRNDYVEIVPAKCGKKAKGNAPPAQIKCPHVVDGLVTDGGDRGRVLAVCADPTCEVHHAESRRQRAAQEKARKEQHKLDERRKEELAIRRRTLAAILQKVTEPAKADLELVAKELFSHLSAEYRTVIAEELKLTENKSASQSDLVSSIEHKLRGIDQAGVCRLLVGMSLLDATFNTYLPQGASQLNTVAKRYRINTEKIRETVTADFAGRRKKQEQRRKERATRKQASAKRRPAA